MTMLTGRGQRTRLTEEKASMLGVKHVDMAMGINDQIELERPWPDGDDGCPSACDVISSPSTLQPGKAGIPMYHHSL
jgi:hypothetical protein